MQIHKLILTAPFFLVASQAPITTPAFLTSIKPVNSLSVPALPLLAPLEPEAPPALPVAPQGTYVNMYDFGNCTWYVAGRKQIPNSWGNATDWAGNATAQGITVSATPRIGAVAQRTGGLGHVAIVLDIAGDQVKITEMNSAGFDVVDERWQPISTYNYIYL